MLGLRERTMSTFILFYFTCAHAGGFTDLSLQRNHCIRLLLSISLYIKLTDVTKYGHDTFAILWV